MSRMSQPETTGLVCWGVFLTAWQLMCAVAVSQETNPQYLGPSSVAVSADGGTLFVACEDACQVLAIDLPTGTVRQRISVPSPPTGLLCPAGENRLLVTCGAPRSTVLRIDPKSGEIVNQVNAGHTTCAPAFDSRYDRLFVCNRFNNDLTVYDGNSLTELTRIPAGREPIAAAVAPDGRVLVVADHMPDSRADMDFRGRVAAEVRIFDLATLEPTLLQLPHGSSSIRGLTVTADGDYALVTHLLSNFQNVPFRVDMGWVNVNVVSLIDLRTKALIGTIGLDELQQGVANPWGIALGMDDGMICVAAAGTHELCVIETSQLLATRARRTMSPLPGAWPVYPSLGESLWRRIALPGKGLRGVAIADGKAYVSQYFSDSIAVVPLTSLDELTPAMIELGPQPQLTQVRRGQMLFEDGTICYQSWQSCSSCHPDARGDALNWDLMNDGIGNPKSSKSMLFSHITPPSMAQGVRETAEEAVRSGLKNILFTNLPKEESTAIDEYLKSLEPVPSPYLVDGQLSDAARRGQQLFESNDVGCHRCHPAPLFTDLQTHSIGIAPSPRFNNRYDTPTLREVWRTAPYASAGSYRTVRELLIEGQHGLRAGTLEKLSEQDIHDLTEFVLSL